MANKATLSVANEEFNVLEFTLTLQQKHDNQGQPASGVYLGDFALILEAGNELFFNWQTDQTRMEDGDITIFRTDQDSKFITYSFEKAFVTSLLESYYANDDLTNVYNQVGTVEDLGGALLNAVMAGFNNQDQYTTNLISQRNAVREFQKRTGNAYCLFVSLSCEKITIRDVEQDNKWGTS